jgi:hypothetical protein
MSTKTTTEPAPRPLTLEEQIIRAIGMDAGQAHVQILELQVRLRASQQRVAELEAQLAAGGAEATA